MAYTNGIFRINTSTGSDAARTALTACTASNPSGTITRINKTGHGLVTGAVVDLTLFTAWLNDAWKITVVDANNFDLDGAVWQTTADASGTVTPRGGSSWSDAWLTIAGGATAARIQAGDEIRLNETPETSTGINATFTNNSRTVTLASALTKTVQNCDGSAGWTASANITLGNNSQRKIGSNSLQITPAAGFTTGKMCYAAVPGAGAQDFSAYTKISFYIRPTAAGAIAANTFRICLCSDTIGDTVVDAFNIPAIIAGTTAFHSYVVTKAGGGALGASIQSVAIYALVDPGTSVITLNNIVACNDFDHNTVFGPQGDCRYVVQAIDGTTLTVDQSSTTAAGQGWSGTAGTYTLYQKNPTAVYNTGTWNTVSEGGAQSAYTTYTGGWDTTSDTRTGETCFLSGLGQSGIAIAGNSYLRFENIGIYRGGANPLNMSSSNIINNCVISNSGAISTSFNCEIHNSFFLNSSAASALSESTTAAGPLLVYNCIIANNAIGAGITRPSNYVSCVFRNNSTASVSMNSQTGTAKSPFPTLRKCLLSDTVEVTDTNNIEGTIWSYDHDQTPGNYWGFTRHGNITWQTTTRQGSDPGAWKITHTGSERTTLRPITVKVAEVAVAASSLVTVTVWVKKDHATNVGCRVYVQDEDYNVTGVVEDIETAANNTSWQQLTLTFTPTVAGVVPIWFDSFYVTANSNTYFGSITVTQA